MDNDIDFYALVNRAGQIELTEKFESLLDACKEAKKWGFRVVRVELVWRNEK